jgi:hypothetical protein
VNTERNVTLTYNDQPMSRYLTLYVPSHCASKPPKYFGRIKPPQHSGNNRAQQFGAYRGGGAGHEVHLGEVHRGSQLLDHVHGALALLVGAYKAWSVAWHKKQHSHTGCILCSSDKVRRNNRQGKYCWAR